MKYSQINLYDESFCYKDISCRIVKDILGHLKSSVLFDREQEFRYFWPYEMDPEAREENWDSELPVFSVSLHASRKNLSAQHSGWNISANAGWDESIAIIYIDLLIDEDVLISDDMLSLFRPELINVVAHECHHMTQSENPFQRNNCPEISPDSYKNFFEYFVSNGEIPAFVIGFRAHSQVSGISQSILIKKYLRNQVDSGLISTEESKKISEIWLSYTEWDK
tara:strand:- start:102 stop:770 length:669 start_codon:yes stop_codon:yes gene_type:complete